MKLYLPLKRSVGQRNIVQVTQKKNPQPNTNLYSLFLGLYEPWAVER